MFGVIAKRFLALLPTAIIGTIIIFSIVQLTPGGVAEAIAGPDATGEFILQIKQELGLDRPLYIQYASWLWQMAHGNFGQSLLTREYITTLIEQRLPVTATIAGEALLIALIVAIPLGIWSASRRGTVVDSTIRTVSGLGLAMPEFWIGMLGINLFALQLAWVPTTGYVPLAKGFGAHFNSTILPALTLACAPTAVLVRTTRSAMVEALEGQYVRAAWALGLSPWQIYLKFAFKNALIPIVTVIGIIASVLIGGAVLIERVFAIPGMGDLLTQGVLTKDFPIVQGTTVVLMVVVIVVNLLVDVAYVMLDPKNARMSETADNVTAASAEGVAPDEPSFYEPKIGLRILYRRPGFGLAVLYMTLLILIGVFASVVAPYDPIKQDYISVLAPFSSAHWLGTDDIGRDVLSRLIWGARPTLIGVVISIATASLIGIPWGLVAGYTGGWLDLALMRLADSVLVFPGIILALALTSALGPSLASTMFSLGVVFSPILARVVRAGVLTVSFKDYVIVTRMYGLSSNYRIWRHVLPNILAPTVVQLTLLSGLSVLAQTGLNFLGLGVPNPNPSWGNSVAETYRYIVVDPMAPVIPGLAVVFTVLAIYRIGDEVRDQLNIY